MLRCNSDTWCGCRRYPYNLKFDTAALAPFLQYSINNLGDPFVTSNYGVHRWAMQAGQAPETAREWLTLQVRMSPQPQIRAGGAQLFRGPLAYSS